MIGLNSSLVHPHHKGTLLMSTGRGGLVPLSSFSFPQGNFQGVSPQANVEMVRRATPLLSQSQVLVAFPCRRNLTFFYGPSICTVKPMQNVGVNDLLSVNFMPKSTSST